MNAPSGLRLRLQSFASSLDPALLATLGALSLIGLITLYSAASDHPGNFGGQLRNFLVAGLVMLLFASLSPGVLTRIAVPVYATGLLALVAVLTAGVSVKGAQRWLDIGFTRVKLGILALAVFILCFSIAPIIG